MINGLNHITLAVNHLDQSFEFYTSILGFKPHAKWESGAYLSCGDIWLCLSLDHVSERSDYSHIAFSIDKNSFKKFKTTLESHPIEQWKINTSEGDSFYFLDPDGHKLEVHCGTLHTRLESCRKAPYKNMIFFD